MSRADHTRARQLVRLRDIGLETALRVLAAANEAMARADAAVATALAARDGATARHAGARAALVDDPADADAGLARIALAADREGLAIAAADAAETERRIAEDHVIAARQAVRRARARLDAMEGLAGRLKRSLVRAAEAHEALESEEGAAAMRTAA